MKVRIISSIIVAMALWAYSANRGESAEPAPAARPPARGSTAPAAHEAAVRRARAAQAAEQRAAGRNANQQNAEVQNAPAQPAAQGSVENNAAALQQATTNAAFTAQGGVNGNSMTPAQQSLLATRQTAAIAQQLVRSNAARQALAAQFAAQNPQLSPAQADQAAAKALAGFMAQQQSGNTANSAITGQAAANGTNGMNSNGVNSTNPNGVNANGTNNGNPSTTAAGQALQAERDSAAVAQQLVASNAATSALAAQIASQNPQLSPQQAQQAAAKALSAITPQPATANSSNQGQGGVNSVIPLTPAQQAGQNLFGPFIPNSGFIVNSGANGVGPNGQLMNGNSNGSGAAGPNAASPDLSQAAMAANGLNQPAIPADGGDAGGGGEAATAQGAALQGAAQVTTAQGQANLANAAAANNMTKAQSNALKNQVEGTQSYWEKRDIGKVERAKEAGPMPSADDLAQRATARAPRALTPSEMNPTTGALYWPGTLKSSGFRTRRAVIDDLTSKWAKNGKLSTADQAQMRENVSAALDMLKSQIKTIPPAEYLASRSFLQSVLYATTRGVL